MKVSESLTTAKELVLQDYGITFKVLSSWYNLLRTVRYNDGLMQKFRRKKRKKILFDALQGVEMDSSDTILSTSKAIFEFDTCAVICVQNQHC